MEMESKFLVASLLSISIKSTKIRKMGYSPVLIKTSYVPQELKKTFQYAATNQTEF